MPINLTVLVGDDDVGVLEMAAVLLEDLGVAVPRGQTGEQAPRRCAAG